MADMPEPVPAYGTPAAGAVGRESGGYVVTAGLRTSALTLLVGLMGVGFVAAGVVQRHVGLGLFGLFFVWPLWFAYREIRNKRVFLSVGGDGIYLGNADDAHGSEGEKIHIPWDDVAAVVIHSNRGETSDGDDYWHDAIGVRTHAPFPAGVTDADIVVHHRQWFTSFGFDHDRFRAAVRHFAPDGTRLVDVPRLTHRREQEGHPHVRVVHPGAG